jgi:hypothetical protein
MTFVFVAETQGSKVRDDETGDSASDEVYISSWRSFVALDRLLARKGQPLYQAIGSRCRTCRSCTVKPPPSSG